MLIGCKEFLRIDYRKRESFHCVNIINAKYFICKMFFNKHKHFLALAKIISYNLWTRIILDPKNLPGYQKIRTA